MIEVRSEYDKGKLLFKWDPEKNIVAIVRKDKLYQIQLNKDLTKGGYKIVQKCDKLS